ncbi:bifunctional DNA primase/polymerase [Kitasatospora sp. NPDC058965]|uniref:bifunctional DNA primase/polymerase n=1 Tax=Kitasatospora sp. NPDC058965 TaxID=3346682 RepID=UPI003676C3AF
MTGNILLAAALAAAARDWHVFPLVPGGKVPAIKAWEQRATTDPERIERCWSFRPYNIGIACGPSGLVVIDQDVPKGPGDTPPARWALPGIADGHDVLAALCEEHGQPYPDGTFTNASPGGSTHLYFRASRGVGLRNTRGDQGLGWKVDTRAGGGQVVAAGSTTPKGAYRTVNDAPVADLPVWLIPLLLPTPLPPQKPVTAPLRAHDRRTAYLKSAVERQLAAVTGAKDHHNDALYLSAVALGQLVAGGELAEAEVTSWLLGAAAQVAHAPAKAARTIASGLRAGSRRPRMVAA